MFFKLLARSTQFPPRYVPIFYRFNVPLKGYDKNGRKVIILRSAVADPNKMTMADNFKTSMMLNELAMKDPSKDFQAQVCGVVIIQDAHGVTLNHMRSFSPAIGKKATTVFQEAYPSNPKAMYFLGMPSFVETAFNMMKGFMKKDKLKNRIQVNTYKYIVYLPLYFIYQVQILHNTKTFFARFVLQEIFQKFKKSLGKKFCLKNMVEPMANFKIILVNLNPD